MGENDIKKELEIKKILNAFTQTRSAKEEECQKTVLENKLIGG